MVGQVLQQILPFADTQGTPTSFERIGHIAHMNLREEMVPYGKIIGQVLLDKTHGLRTVVNKVWLHHINYCCAAMSHLAPVCGCALPS